MNTASMTMAQDKARERAAFVRAQLPSQGLFAGHDWRVAPAPFRLAPELLDEFAWLGRVLLQFYRAANLLYRHSVEGKQPEWAARWLDLGKPSHLIALQRAAAFKSDVPRVIRPDILLTEEGFSITELDSIPGGIGLTAWLNRTYAAIPGADFASTLTGGREGMERGFEGIFGDARRVHIVVSEEAATYRPEMAWLAERLGGSRFQVQSATFDGFEEGDAVYRFFELFDVANVPNADRIFQLAGEKRIQLTPPPKMFLEEKMLFALLWNRNLRGFWRSHLGESFLDRLQRHVPCSWVFDPTPLPPHAGLPDLHVTDWHQLKGLSQRERELILKVSGFSDKAWGARGVFLGSDLSSGDWSHAVDEALDCFERSPYVLQRYHKPKVIEAEWFDFEKNEAATLRGRVRLCPYYFVIGDGDNARAHLGGVLATICPADKKIIHGMKEAILAPCSLMRE